MFRKIAFSLAISVLLSTAPLALDAEENPPAPDTTVTNVAHSATQAESPVKSLAMLMQVITSLEDLVKSKDLSSIHNEDWILSMTMRGLLDSAPVAAPGQTNQFKSDLIALGLAVSKLHTAADNMNQSGAEAELRNVLSSFRNVRAHLTDATRTSAEALAFRYTCPMHPDVVGARTDLCPKCGMPLDQLIRILPPYLADSQQSIRASIRTVEPLTVGKEATAILRLERITGQRILLSDLIETHTKKIHLLIIDKSLTDYHHEHPQPTDTPGEYAFGFTPKKPGSYRVWADLRPYPLGLQEYVMTDIPAPTAPELLTDRSLSFKTSVDGLNYELILEQDLIRVGTSVPAKLRVTTPDGMGFTQLEPIMATFAHIVGFNEDFKTVLHMHPKGAPILNPAARGGPELDFQIYALKAGFYRVFAQVQIGGRSHFAPFGIQVRP